MVLLSIHEIVFFACLLPTINTNYDVCLNELFNYDVRFLCHSDLQYTWGIINRSADVLPSEELNANNPEPPIAPFEDWAKLKIKEHGEKQPAMPTNAERNVKAVRNYAGKECGAKILEASPEAQNPSAVLNDKELDEYMLNPCASEVPKWIVVELCETVQIGRFEMANFELFSCRPKDFKIWISKRYPDPDWVLMGQFLAEDRRETHMFPIDQRRFYAKYLKVELISHYGIEHLSSLTFIRVLGVSMVEEYENDAAAAAASTLLHEEHVHQSSNLSSNDSASSTEAITLSIEQTITTTSDKDPKQTSTPSAEEQNGGNHYLQDAKSAMLSAAKQFYGKVFNVADASSDRSNAKSLLNLTRNKACQKKSRTKNLSRRRFDSCTQCPVNNFTHSLCALYVLSSISSDLGSLVNDSVDAIDMRPNASLSDGASTPTSSNATDVKSPAESEPSPKNDTHEPVAGAAGIGRSSVLVGVMGGHRESVFARMNQRLRSLELNVSLSSQYLTELSRRYARQMQHIERAFNATSRLFSETDKKFQQRLDQQAADLLTLAERLAKLEIVLASFLASFSVASQSASYGAPSDSLWEHTWCAAAIVANLVIVALCRRAFLIKQDELVRRLRDEFRLALRNSVRDASINGDLPNGHVDGVSNENGVRNSVDRNKKKKHSKSLRHQHRSAGSLPIECVGDVE